MMVDDKGHGQAAHEGGGMRAQAPAARDGDKGKLHKIIDDHLPAGHEGAITAEKLRALLNELVDAI